VQADPIKPPVKAPGIKRSNLKHDTLLSAFGFKINLRRYDEDDVDVDDDDDDDDEDYGGGDDRGGDDVEDDDEDSGGDEQEAE